jgi:dUTP pyrophosphatase
MLDTKSSLNVAGIKKLHSAAKIPTQADPKAAGYDLYTVEGYELAPNERKMFKTGISMNFPSGHYGQIAPRSGLAAKHGIQVFAGVCDENYTGEICVILYNSGIDPVQIKAGDRIAQLIFIPCNNKVTFVEVEELNQTERAENGFGSSGR